MANNPAIGVAEDYISVKFAQTIKVSSIALSGFQLWSNGATPAQISNPFQALDLASDYDTVGRILKLFFAVQLNPSELYQLRVSGLTDVAGRAIPPQTYDFTSAPNTTFTTTEVPPEPTFVEDHSIIATPFVTTNTIEASNPEFYVVETDPPIDSLFINSNENNGRVTVKFSNFPAHKYLNSTYFKVQRKLITRAGVTRWEPVPVTLSLDPVEPWVYIDFPLSNDATPVYFANSYKYRIKLSKDIGT